MALQPPLPALQWSLGSVRDPSGSPSGPSILVQLQLWSDWAESIKEHLLGDDFPMAYEQIAQLAGSIEAARSQPIVFQQQVILTLHASSCSSASGLPLAHPDPLLQSESFDPASINSVGRTGSSTGQHQQRFRAAARVRAQGGLICYNCNQPGHIRPDCPLIRLRSRTPRRRSAKFDKIAKEIVKPLISTIRAQPEHGRPDCSLPGSQAKRSAATGGKRPNYGIPCTFCGDPEHSRLTCCLYATHLTRQFEKR